VLRTSATRGFFGAASVALWDSAIVEWVDIFHRVKVRPRWSVDLTVYRLAGHDQTPKQPEGAMVEAGISTDAVPRDRRRSEYSEWFQPGHTRGPTKVGIRGDAVPGVRGRRVCVGPPIGMFRACVRTGMRRLIVTTSAGDAATGSR